MIIPASRNDYAAGFADGYRQGKKDAERKTGRWINDRLVTTNGGTYAVRRCPFCESYYQDVGYGWDYCPNCGADMRGEEK